MAMRERIVAVLIASVLLTAGAAAEDGAASVIERFVGEWASGDDALGGPAQTIMIWSPALGGAFFRIDYEITMKPGAEDQSTFAGVGYYQKASGAELSGFWADNAGDMHPIKAVLDGGAILSTWGVDGGKLGRTRYELQSDDVMTVTDWIMTGDGWRQFNQNRFERAE